MGISKINSNRMKNNIDVILFSVTPSLGLKKNSLIHQKKWNNKIKSRR